MSVLITNQDIKMNNVLILSDSLNSVTGTRLTTFLLPRFPTVLWDQYLTHRAVSRNSESLRAKPLNSAISSTLADPYVPLWVAKQKGMGGLDILSSEQKEKATRKWLELRDLAIEGARYLHEECGVAKENANRALSPYIRGVRIMSATDWEPFFRLRTKPGSEVQADSRAVAIEMERLYRESQPKVLRPGEWHTPFVDQFLPDDIDLIVRIMVSAARCARGSYANHLGEFSIEDDIRLCRDLIVDEHPSPLEHQAVATATIDPIRQRNYRGFYQFRHHIQDRYWTLAGLPGA